MFGRRPQLSTCAAVLCRFVPISCGSKPLPGMTASRRGEGARHAAQAPTPLRVETQAAPRSGEASRGGAGNALRAPSIACTCGIVGGVPRLPQAMRRSTVTSSLPGLTRQSIGANSFCGIGWTLGSKRRLRASSTRFCPRVTQTGPNDQRVHHDTRRKAQRFLTGARPRSAHVPSFFPRARARPSQDARRRRPFHLFLPGTLNEAHRNILSPRRSARHQRRGDPSRIVLHGTSRAPSGRQGGRPPFMWRSSMAPQVGSTPRPRA